jgi:hypothetical protein
MNAVRIAVAALLFTAWGVGHAHIQVFTGTLSPEATGATGSGTVTVEYEEEMHSLTVTTSFAGLSGVTTVAHIHCCVTTAGSGTAIVAVKAPTLDGFPAGVQSGDYSGTFDLSLASNFNQAFINGNGGSVGAAEAALVAAMVTGRAYLNIHTSPNFLGGEIRAFLTPAVPIPEPGTYALVIAGLGLLGCAARARRR